MPDESSEIADEKPKIQGILDNVSLSQQTAALRALNPQSFILEFLRALEPRERQILTARYGLEDGQPQTLETIGQHLGLTRERVRQIEKESLKKLNQAALPENLSQAVDLIFQMVEGQGNIAPEGRILESLLLNQPSPTGKRGILFILNFSSRFNLYPETQSHHQAWFVTGFDQSLFEQTIAAAEKILAQGEKPLPRLVLFEKIRNEPDLPAELKTLSDEALESYLTISKSLDRNAFQDWGLAGWTDIHPKDVGDKVYLILSHHKKPEHYATITEMINRQGFDKRQAHKETVHNELIKDDRFVLVGRGIYALKEWGYQKGVVAEIIQKILREAGRPLSRDEIVMQVLKQRLVKKNTIIVGLSNRKLFQKTPDNRYQNVQ